MKLFGVVTTLVFEAPDEDSAKDLADRALSHIPNIDKPQTYEVHHADEV